MPDPVLLYEFTPDKVSDSGNLFLVAPHVDYILNPGSVIKFTLLESD